MPTSVTHTNRLINEKSPYLLQHAHNPVDWYPWGDEAFNKAKAEGKPVFLSIGYSTCHWCHVMERESFEDREVAALLNQNFISIKVDREERPDIDSFYMDACMALTGSGGWPLSCFLTHDRKPFFSGTYFPKNDGLYGTGFLSVLTRVSEIWEKHRSKLLKSGDEILNSISQNEESPVLKRDIEISAFNQLESSFDKEYGGFGSAPKFPSLQNLLFLMQYGMKYDNKRSFEMVQKTLDSMYAGGIFDHVGSGFCRYSTDEKWLIPHFEKMMYDNAMHIIAYSQAFALFGGNFADVARSITQFCTREMLDDAGGFYTAIDADSEGVEGKFYVFTPAEISEALGGADGSRYSELFNITPHGNFEGKSVPNHIGTALSKDDRQFAKICGEKLYKFRSNRIPPFKDDKSLTLINGLMIAALAIEGRTLREPEYIAAAERCADFVLTSLIKDGRLQGRWRKGEAGIPATSDDYAGLIWGLIELYEATFCPKWLEKAVELTGSMNALFWDEKRGGYYLSGNDVNDLPMRQKNKHDGALPSGNSIAAQNLVRLSRLCANVEFEKYANKIVNMMSPLLNSYPAACCGLLSTLLYLKDGGTEIILINGDGLDELKSCLPVYSPFTVTALAGGGYEKMFSVAPFLNDYKPIDGKATAYVCHGGVCHKPVTATEALLKLIDNDRKRDNNH